MGQTPLQTAAITENNNSPVQVMGTLQTVLTTGIATTPQVTSATSSPSQPQEQPTQVRSFYKETFFFSFYC
jgi:hypothetical protein